MWALRTLPTGRRVFLWSMHYVNAIWLVPTYIPTFRREVFDVGVMAFSESDTHPTKFIYVRFYVLSDYVALDTLRCRITPHSTV